MRSAETIRAVLALPMARPSRKQLASKYGQAFSEHWVPSGRISSRSPLPLLIGALATTWSLKLGRTVTAPAINAAARWLRWTDEHLVHDTPLSIGRFLGLS